MEATRTERETAAPNPEAPSALAAFLDRPMLKYLGFALLLAWHYTLWFIPDLFCDVALLDDRVTDSWIVNLVATSAFLFLIAGLLGRKRHLSDYAAVLPAAVGVAAGGTLALGFLPFDAAPAWIFSLIAVILGAAEAALWILWGEYYARVKANFTISHIGTVFGLALFLCTLVAYLLPSSVVALFAAVLPALSGIILRLMGPAASDPFPPLLPKSATRSGVKNMMGVGFVTLFACTACYFLDCIIPWDTLPTGDASFTFGILCGGVIILAIAGIYTLSRDRLNIFKIYPGLLVVIMMAFALFLASDELWLLSFVIGIGAQALFEILLIMYFGILTSKGYATPAITFAMAGGFVRLGLALGNSWALAYEANPALAAAITPETCLALMCLLAVVLVPLVRLEFNIVALTAAPPSKSEIEEICAEVAAELSLSAREGEILLLIARGHTTNSMAEKLVISPYTVNTHIRHIYDKMQIHKRSELLNYLNMQRSDF